MKKIVGFITLIVLTCILTGCMYPDELKTESQIPGQDQLDSVQKAIDTYQADTGVLPIKNSEEDTDLFIKYKIDFEKLVPKYLSQAPANAYEKGGLFQYVIWDAENKPTVRLIDLRTPDTLRDVNSRMMIHSYPTFGPSISDNIYEINYKMLGFSQPLTVKSPYTTNDLPLILATNGIVYVDYSADIQQLIENDSIQVQAGQDIRTVIANEFPVLPAYSLPYILNENNEVTFDLTALQ